MTTQTKFNLAALVRLRRLLRTCSYRNKYVRKLERVEANLIKELN